MGRRISSRVLDWSGGLIGGVSDYARRVRHARIADNVLLDPVGAWAVRKGSQRFCSATLANIPNTVMEYVTSSGGGRVFEGSDGGAAGSLTEVTAGAFTAQTTPYILQVATKHVWDQLHGSLFTTEQAGGNSPMFYRASNPANVWHTAILPRPAFPLIVTGTPVTGAGAGLTVAAPGVLPGQTTFNLSGNATVATGDYTLVFGTSPALFSVPNCQVTLGSPVVTYDGPTAAAQTQMTLTGAGGGGLTAGQTYYYRLRYRYLHGSSVASGPHTIALGGNTQVQITNIANEIRTDYLGWTLERTKVGGGPTIGPYYFVADGTGTTYNDITADADLGYRSDPNVHFEPPHFNGLIAYKDRLVGWVGSTVWFSQSVGDIEATGICNWNPLNALDIGPDDGDPISSVVQQVDRLIVMKRWSTWAVEGDDISSYRTLPLHKGAGCSGPRAAAAIGGAVYFYGDAGMHRVNGNRVEPFGWTEVGHVFKTIKPAQAVDVVVRNYLGQHLLVFFSSAAAHNDDGLAWDVRFGAWSRIVGWFVHDLLVQKAGTFGNAQAVVIADRKDRDPTAGFDYPIWLGFYGFKDEKASNGTGGIKPRVTVQTPYIDDGSPDVMKDWEAIQLFLSGVNISVSATLLLDPQNSAVISVATNSSGALWGAPNWGAFNWGQTIDAGPATGLPAGTFGRRYALKVYCEPEAEFGYGGYVLDGIVQPKADYSRS